MSSSGLGKKTANSKSVNNRDNTSALTSNRDSQNRKDSKLKPVSGFDYLRDKENNGVSLYAHVQALLDVLIFQNPMQPVTHFEYYSENLKKQYRESPSDPDLDFLNNIEKNVFDRTTDKYKWIWDSRFKIKENHDLEDRASGLSYGEDILGYEGEYEDDGKNSAEPNVIAVQNLSEVNRMLNKAGCGLTNDEVGLIGITMEQMLSLGKMKNIRYWGKILGLKRNYYVLECEWRDEELEYRLRTLNNKMNKNANLVYEDEHIYENEGEIEPEKDVLSMESVTQLVEDENGYKSAMSTAQKTNNERSKLESQTLDFQESKSLCIPVDEPSTSDDSSNEIIGFGANKKSYFVTNKLSDDWVELPPLKSHHVVQSRNIKRYFVGDLESRVESYPLFQGLEKHYLRAQIARISAATHISPRDYFALSGDTATSKKWRKLTVFQSNAMSKKGVHDYVLNQNYHPPQIYALLNPANWIHHTPLITGKGVTKAWTKLGMSEEPENEKTEMAAEEDAAAAEEDAAAAGDFDESPDILGPLSDDAHVGGVSPWKIELTNPFDHAAAHVCAKSNLWPGAFAVARHNVSDCAYVGWGHKRTAADVSFTPLAQPTVACQAEYPSDATETADPTRADELSFYAAADEARERRRSARRTSALAAADAADEEDREKIIQQHYYD